MARQRLKPGEHGEIFIAPHNGTWRAKVRVRQFNGKEAQVSRKGRTPEAARLAVQNAMSEQLDRPGGSAELKNDDKVGFAARQWINELRAKSRWPNPPIRPQTVDEYERLLANHLVPRLGAHRLYELTPALCQDWVNEIIESGKGGPNDMVVTATQVRGAFRAILDRAILHDALRHNPVDKIEVPKRKMPEPKAMTIKDVYRLRKAVREWETAREGRPGPRPTGHLPAAVDVLLGTGLRVGEVMSLLWGEVNLSPDGVPTIAVSATLVDVKGEGTIRQEMTKTDAGVRTIIIPTFCVEALESIRPHLTTPDLPVFPSRRFKDGRVGLKSQTPHNIRRTLRAALELAEMTGEVHPHLLRSTVATFVARQRGVADAAALLGHKINGGVTTRHYIERLRLAPDVSSVLQEVIEIGEEQARVEAERAAQDAPEIAQPVAITTQTTATAEDDAVAEEVSGW